MMESSGLGSITFVGTFKNECPTFAPATIAPAVNPNVVHNPNPNPNPNPNLNPYSN